MSGIHNRASLRKESILICQSEGLLHGSWPVRGDRYTMDKPTIMMFEAGDLKFSQANKNRDTCFELCSMLSLAL